jgi:hypothetical protein
MLGYKGSMTDATNLMDLMPDVEKYMFRGWNHLMDGPLLAGISCYLSGAPSLAGWRVCTCVEISECPWIEIEQLSWCVQHTGQGS